MLLRNHSRCLRILPSHFSLQKHLRYVINKKVRLHIYLSISNHLQWIFYSIKTVFLKIIRWYLSKYMEFIDVWKIKEYLSFSRIWIYLLQWCYIAKCMKYLWVLDIVLFPLYWIKNKLVYHNESSSTKYLRFYWWIREVVDMKAFVL